MRLSTQPTCRGVEATFPGFSGRIIVFRAFTWRDSMNLRPAMGIDASTLSTWPRRSSHPFGWYGTAISTE
jgi:hypothetical protein